MDSSVLVQILGASAIATVLGAVVQGIINKRKLSAEATSIITQAAGGLVKDLQTDNGRLRAENARSSLREERSRYAVRRRDDAFRRVLDGHSKWDRLVVKALREAGIQIPDPPELYLPDVDYDDDDDTLSTESPSPGN